MRRLPGLLLVAALASGCVEATTGDPAAPPVAGSLSTLPSTSAPVDGDPPAPTTGTWSGTVTHVSDGDTLRIVVDLPGRTELRPGDELRVRLLRIDTPELSRDGQPAECLAEAARDALARLAPPGTPVTAWRDVEAQDRYGRELAHLWLDDGTWVNGTMVAAGFADVVTFPPNVAYDDEVRDRQRAARDAGRGLWSACD